jgi:hypothetical protein
VKLYQRVQLDLARAVRRALREYGSVRTAAAAIGMPKSTFHDYMKKGRKR